MNNFSERMTAKLNPNQVGSLVDAFIASCNDYADRPAFSCLGHTLSFAELESLSARFASYLTDQMGLKTGDRIAIQLPNITQYPIAVWGAWRAGLVVVNTNPMYTFRELIHQFNDSGAVALVVLDSLLETTKELLSDTAIEKVLVTSVVDLVAPEQAYDVTLSEREQGMIGFTEAIERGAESFEGVDLAMSDLAVLQYTGGTTGPSKGAMLSHSNLFCARVLARESVVLSEPGSKEILIAVLPVYHVFGFTQNVIGSVLYGSLSVMIPDPRNVDSIISAMKSYPFTNMAAVNTLLSALMAHPEFENIDFSHITGVVVGGTALVKEIGEEWQQRTNTMLYEGYGLSETCANGSCNTPESHELGTVGPCLKYSEIMLISEEGSTCKRGERGEICIRGPHVMQGYWGRPDATAEVISEDGWFKTGDVGVFNQRGHLKIVDRIKDMVIVSGFNVYPNEVEAVIYGHPNVTECAVIGVPDAATGEAIKLYVVTNDQDLSAEALIKFCRSELAAYKVPRQIVFMDDLPKSPAGKILRRELRELSKS